MIKPMHPGLIFLLDLWLWVKAFLCLIRRHHHGSVRVSDVVRKGYRPIPMFQCRWCNQFYIREADAARTGGRRLKVVE